jgi:hypothetical protein
MSFRGGGRSGGFRGGGRGDRGGGRGGRGGGRGGRGSYDEGPPAEICGKFPCLSNSFSVIKSCDRGWCIHARC